MPSLPKLPPVDLRALKPLVEEHVDWVAWEWYIRSNGITIDRPEGTSHPDFSSVIYPLDYGFVNRTLATDGAPIDIFVGSSTTGLVGTLLTTDHRQQDREFKLLYDCTPVEVYTVHGFINYDRSLLTGVLVLRSSMPALWDETE